jgi:hypothetical protein
VGSPEPWGKLSPIPLCSIPPTKKKQKKIGNRTDLFLFVFLLVPVVGITPAA